MKKQLLLITGIVALYLAAKEYGVNSFDDLKRVASPYLRLLNLEELNLA